MGRCLTGRSRAGYVARHAAHHTPDDAGSCRPQACVLRRVSPGLTAQLREERQRGCPPARFTTGAAATVRLAAVDHLEGHRGSPPAARSP
ncbi:hypothetical protein SCOCK_430050 [Actinacidiphila cocklensis]|uniref:Uncharacterized protein n=1 Tax=Actinacidiphila cocklensis TaxID=887465 RepID=A0A9W4E9U3_9ACTN|nr:hypothetical protein SCOCK_430050 [Actinacidiphila cocklensis]